MAAEIRGADHRMSAVPGSVQSLGETKRSPAETPRAELLFSEPYRFGFFQAVRLLARMYPEKSGVGEDAPPDAELVRFRSMASLAFPPSELVDLVPGRDPESPPEMTVAFAGLIGASGVMPNPYTELVIERKRFRDTALWDFLDLFTHRQVSLFYRAWEKYRFPIKFEKGEPDRVTEGLLALVGLGTTGLRDRMAVPDLGVIYYAGLISQRPHSGSAISAILSDYFGVPAAAVPFIGMWHPLEPENLTRMGETNSELGRNLIAGEQVLIRQSKFRVRLGPLWLEQFTDFLPTGRSLKALGQLTRYLAGPEFDFDIQLVLRAEEVPMCQLSSKAPLLPMLGWTTWIRTRELENDCDDVVFTADF